MEDAFRLCDLPDGVVIDILDRINSVARVRFSAVCKAWKLLLRRLLPLLAEAKEVPWFVTIDVVHGNQSMVLHQICLGNLQQKPCAKIKRILKQELVDAITLRTVDPHVSLRSTNFGWVVLEGRTMPPAPCLYSPFTDKFIHLPPGLPPLFRRFAMSHPPTCSDCLLFALADCTTEVFAYTCRLGDKNWKKHDIEIDIRGPTNSLMFLEGSFYCLFRSGQLVAFKVADESWKLLADSMPLEDATPLHAVCRNHRLADCDGDILLVPSFYLPRSPRDCGCSVWKYEWAEKSWRKMKNLGGRVLFLSVEGSENVAVAAVGELDGLADRIYLSFGRNLKNYFSLPDGNFHFCNEYDYKIAYWIMPPRYKFEVAFRANMRRI